MNPPTEPIRDRRRSRLPTLTRQSFTILYVEELHRLLRRKREATARHIRAKLSREHITPDIAYGEFVFHGRTLTPQEWAAKHVEA